MTTHTTALPRGPHGVHFGNDPAAKPQVTELLQSFGWADIVDLGDITTARGTEMYLPLWIRLWGATQSPIFNIKVVRQMRAAPRWPSSHGLEAARPLRRNFVRSERPPIALAEL
jgi:hypothetical protein